MNNSSHLKNNQKPRAAEKHAKAAPKAGIYRKTALVSSALLLCALIFFVYLDLYSEANAIKLPDLPPQEISEKTASPQNFNSASRHDRAAAHSRGDSSHMKYSGSSIIPADGHIPLPEDLANDPHAEYFIKPGKKTSANSGQSDTGGGKNYRKAKTGIYYSPYAEKLPQETNQGEQESGEAATKFKNNNFDTAVFDKQKSGDFYDLPLPPENHDLFIADAEETASRAYSLMQLIDEKNPENTAENRSGLYICSAAEGKCGIMIPGNNVLRKLNLSEDESRFTCNSSDGLSVYYCIFEPLKICRISALRSIANVEKNAALNLDNRIKYQAVDTLFKEEENRRLIACEALPLDKGFIVFISYPAELSRGASLFSASKSEKKHGALSSADAAKAGFNDLHDNCLLILLFDDDGELIKYRWPADFESAKIKTLYCKAAENAAFIFNEHDFCRYKVNISTLEITKTGDTN